MAGTWGPGAAAAPGWARGRRRLRCCSRGAASALAWAPGSAPRSRSQGGCECATADGGAAELRPVRSGRQSFCRPRADLTPLPLSPPAPRLPPLSPCCPPPSFSLYRPPPPCAPSAGITCRHHTHCESLPRLSPRFRSNEDTWLPSSVRPPRSHLPLLRGGAHGGLDQAKGPQPQTPQPWSAGEAAEERSGRSGCCAGEGRGARAEDLPLEPPRGSLRARSGGVTVHC